MSSKPLRSRRLIIPEVVQTSAMDCGPASLKSLFEGFGVSLSYGRLREACQTDVDGTSIDTVEDIASQLGFGVQQTMIPVDHVLLPEARALPAIIVTSLPNGLNHFVVVWRAHGRLVQVMDPATGRRWPSYERFLKEVYSHVIPVPAAAWRKWAGSEEFIDPLRRRLGDLGIERETSERLINGALQDSGWRSVASLDASARMIHAITRSGGIGRGRQAGRALEVFFNRTLNEQTDSGTSIIPGIYWSVRFAGRAEDQSEFLSLKGAVIVRVRTAPEKITRIDAAKDKPATQAKPIQTKPLSTELAAALEEAPARPGRELFRILKQDGILAPAGLLAALLLASGGIVFEALLFRGLLDIGRQFGLITQQLQALFVLIVFVTGLLLLELPITDGLQKFGRHVEARLRIAILKKLPRLGDRYFRSRLTSDMTERSHSLYAMRALPGLAGQMLRSIFGLALTAIGISILDPASAPLAFLIALVSIALPLLTQPIVTDRDLRVRTHAGALTRFYLDALLGLAPVRAHGAERAIKREHESLLVEWARSSFGLQRRIVIVEALHAFISFALAALILFNYLDRTAETASALLIIYWSLNLPALGQVVAQIAQQYPVYRNITGRLLEPLGAPEDNLPTSVKETDSDEKHGFVEKNCKAVSLEFHGVSVKASGHVILEGIEIEIEAGSHVAIIGPSGAGKSSLVGLLLGWHKPYAGRVLADGAPLDGEALEKLRIETAWVDPTVQVWNQSLLDNLRYGTHSPTDLPLSKIIELSQLSDALRKFPEGLQTNMGEAGGFVSGGEGQRVRLARGMLRPGVRLAILDEPFRGLDREHRRELLSNSRLLWREATLLCITHDVSETMGFDRVIVIENGSVIEDGKPQELLNRPGSRYGEMIEAESALHEEMWGNVFWRRLRLEDGRLINK